MRLDVLRGKSAYKLTLKEYVRVLASVFFSLPLPSVTAHALEIDRQIDSLRLPPLPLPPAKSSRTHQNQAHGIQPCGSTVGGEMPTKNDEDSIDHTKQSRPPG